MIKERYKSAVFGAVACCTMATPGLADMHSSSLDGIVSVDVAEGWRQSNGRHISAIKMRLAPGWKTYWRVAGDGGLPTKITFDGSSNLANARIIWPHPMVFNSNGVRSIGYQDSAVFPIEITPMTDGPIALNAALQFGICADVCVPVTIHLNQILSPLADQQNPAISAALTSGPRDTGAQVACRVDNQGQITAQFETPELQGEALVIEPSDPAQWISAPKLQRDGDVVTAHAQIDLGGASLDADAIRFTLIGQHDWVEMTGCN